MRRSSRQSDSTSTFHSEEEQDEHSRLLVLLDAACDQPRAPIQKNLNDDEDSKDSVSTSVTLSSEDESGAQEKSNMPIVVSSSTSTPSFRILGRRLIFCREEQDGTNGVSLYNFCRTWFLSGLGTKTQRQLSLTSLMRPNQSINDSPRQVNNNNTRNERTINLEYKNGTELFSGIAKKKRRPPSKETLLAALKEWSQNVRQV